MSTRRVRTMRGIVGLAFSLVLVVLLAGLTGQGIAHATSTKCNGGPGVDTRSVTSDECADPEKPSGVAPSASGGGSEPSGEPSVGATGEPTGEATGEKSSSGEASSAGSSASGGSSPYSTADAPGQWANGVAGGAGEMTDHLTDAWNRIRGEDLNGGIVHPYSVMFGFGLIIMAFALILQVRRLADSAIAREELMSNLPRFLFYTPMMMAVPAIIRIFNWLAVHMASQFQDLGGDGWKVFSDFLKGSWGADVGTTFVTPVALIVFGVVYIMFCVLWVIEDTVAEWGVYILMLLVPIVGALSLHRPNRKMLSRAAGIIIGVCLVPTVTHWAFWVMWFAGLDQIAERGSFWGLIGSIIVVAMSSSAPLILGYVMPMLVPGGGGAYGAAGGSGMDNATAAVNHAQTGANRVRQVLNNSRGPSGSGGGGTSASLEAGDETAGGEAAGGAEGAAGGSAGAAGGGAAAGGAAAGGAVLGAAVAAVVAAVEGTKAVRATGVSASATQLQAAGGGGLSDPQRPSSFTVPGGSGGGAYGASGGMTSDGGAGSAEGAAFDGFDDGGGDVGGYGAAGDETADGERPYWRDEEVSAVPGQAPAGRPGLVTSSASPSSSSSGSSAPRVDNSGHATAGGGE